MNEKIIAVVNHKCDVGKTIIVFNLWGNFNKFW